MLGACDTPAGSTHEPAGLKCTQASLPLNPTYLWGQAWPACTHMQAARLNQQISDAERKQADYVKNAATCAAAFKQVGAQGAHWGAGNRWTTCMCMR